MRKKMRRKIIGIILRDFFFFDFWVYLYREMRKEKDDGIDGL